MLTKKDKASIKKMNKDLKQMDKDRIKQAPNFTLGKLIKELEKCPQNAKVTFENGIPVNDWHSYRGYYEDGELGCDPFSKDLTVRGLIRYLTAQIGTYMCGYKGGEFKVSRKTLVWAGGEGHCYQKAVTCVTVLGTKTVVLKTTKIDSF